LQTLIVGRLTEERVTDDGLRVKTVQLANRARVLKPFKARGNRLMRIRRNQPNLGSSFPKYATISCDCPVLDALLTSTSYGSSQRRFYGRWLMMGSLSRDGQTLHVDFLTKMSPEKAELRKMTKQLMVAQNSLCASSRQRFIREQHQFANK
ncbi:hypothetical protein Ciccas_011405, partial [Cichlidogyrus casuarinus]